jgi:hypothetical protein
MISRRQLNISKYVHSNAPHECGHIVALFTKGRFAGLNFLPHLVAADGSPGVLETDAGVQLGKEDCIGLAAGMVGELICVGRYNSRNALDDKKRVQEITGQSLEEFALGAYEVIKENLFFFALLSVEVRQRMFARLDLVFSLSAQDYAKLPDEISIITLAEVEEVYKRAESTLADFSPGE